MQNLEERILELQQQMAGTFDIHLAENMLHSIADEFGPSSIRHLIMLMDDQFIYDEFMHTIIQRIESFEISIYLTELLNSIPESIYHSPRWLSSLHMRILNSKEAVLPYILILKVYATEEQKHAIRKLLNSINAESPEFLARTTVLTPVLVPGQVSG